MHGRVSYSSLASAVADHLGKIAAHNAVPPRLCDHLDPLHGSISIECAQHTALVPQVSQVSIPEAHNAHISYYDVSCEASSNVYVPSFGVFCLLRCTSNLSLSQHTRKCSRIDLPIIRDGCNKQYTRVGVWCVKSLWILRSGIVNSMVDAMYQLRARHLPHALVDRAAAPVPRVPKDPISYRTPLLVLLIALGRRRICLYRTAGPEGSSTRQTLDCIIPCARCGPPAVQSYHVHIPRPEA